MQPLTTASVAATTTTNVAAVAIGAVVGVCPCALYACLCDIAIVGKVILWVKIHFILGWRYAYGG